MQDPMIKRYETLGSEPDVFQRGREADHRTLHVQREKEEPVQELRGLGIGTNY